MADISTLIEVLIGDDKTDLHQKFRTDAVKLGLKIFYSVLKHGLEPIGNGNLGFHSWSQSQIHAVVTVAQLIVSATKSLSVAQSEPILVATVQQALEFSTIYLEKSEFSGDDLSIQNDVVQLLEIALFHSINKESDSSPSCSLDSLVDVMPVPSVAYGDIEFVNKIICNVQGRFNCSRVEKPIDQLLMPLATDLMQLDNETPEFTTYYQDLNKFVSLSQHWAVVHMGCIRRYIVLCKNIVESMSLNEETIISINFLKKMSFCLRVLKLLVNIAKVLPYVESDAALLQEVSLLADKLPGLFKHEVEFVYNNAAIENSLEGVVLLLLEEFLHLVQLIFGNSIVVQNLNACITLKALDNLGSSIWTYNKFDANPKVPLAYLPRSVLYLLKLIEDIKKEKYQILDWKEFGQETDSFSMYVDSQRIVLLKKYSVEELLKIIFHSSKNGLNNLMNLVCFLHSEGVKLRPKLDRSYSSCVKTGCVTEQDNTVCHEDEALFGDLFSEGGRSVGSVEDHQHIVPIGSASSSYCHMTIQASTELLNFLKKTIFSPEYPLIFEDSCRKLTRNHIDILFSILNCQECYSDEDKKIGLIHEICFELLHNLSTHHALSDSIEEYLVDRILKVENGLFMYNDQTLTLLAHIVFIRLGTSGAQIRTKIYKRYAEFILEKVEFLLEECPRINEVLVFLPSAFHIEILLMAFHLSSEKEKENLAIFIFDSLRFAIDAPKTGFTDPGQLSCWALVVSRLVLVFRHMIFHSSSCPHSLLLDLKSKFSKASILISHPSNINKSGYLSSLVSVAVESIVGPLTRDNDDAIINLLNQLIDVETFPGSCCKDDFDTKGLLSFSWDDIIVPFSRILLFWKGEKAASFEDLIVEKYMFALCWDIPIINDSTLDKSNMKYFFHMCKIESPNTLVDVLEHMYGEEIEELGWDFLRNKVSLSLILSLLNVGTQQYSTRNSIPKSGSNSIENQFKNDDEYLTLAENLVSNVFEATQVPTLLKILSSLLTKCLQNYQNAFLSIFKDNSQQLHDERIPLLLLLKHSSFDKSMQSELLGKYGSTIPSHLDSIFDLIIKLDGTLERSVYGIVSRVFWESMLHGIPSHRQDHSGILVSCILTIRDIVQSIDGLLKIKDSDAKSFCLETEVSRQILDSVMIIKFDRIFVNLHQNCEAVFHRLSLNFEGSNFENLFLLKQMETFLRDINSMNVSDNTTVHEYIVTKAIDTMILLREDLSGAIIFKFFLCMEDVTEMINYLYGSQRCDLTTLIDLLDKCFSESVNIKVLNFFVSLISQGLCSDLKQMVQKKILSMDLPSLSKWIEKRMLGCVVDDAKESTMNFVTCLVSPPSELLSKHLHSHIFEAMLILLDDAFVLYNIHTTKSYFNSVLQFSNGITLMKLLLKKTVGLMEKLACEERFLEGLQYIFCFFRTILTDCKSKNSNNAVENFPERPFISSNFLGSRKNSESLSLSEANQESGLSFECDATSVDDEDEDDGTSDGEVASLDYKDEEEEDGDSERALASRVCTFTSSGSNFMEQHWYFCYTCDLTLSKGCCSVCAKVCHHGHRVVYSRFSRFFCDCGAGGVRGSSCQCLKPRKYTGSNNTAPVRGPVNNIESFLPLIEDGGDQVLPCSDSDLDENAFLDLDKYSFKLSVSKEFYDELPLLLEELDVECRVLELCSSLMPSIVTQRYANFSKTKMVNLGKDKVLSYGVDILQLKKAYKSGSLDLKIKADYTNAKEIKSLLSSGSLVKSLLSVSLRGRLAVGEGDKVAIFDVGQLIGQATIAPLVTTDKSNVKPLSKNVVRFEIVHLVFNPVVENYLAVAGYEDCQVLTVSPRGEITDRLAIELALHGAYIRRIDWVPLSQVQLMVVTNMFVKIYDLSQDNISPTQYFTLPNDIIIDATLSMAGSNRLFLIVLSESGNLYKMDLSLMEGNAGPKQMNEIIEIREQAGNAKGSSLFFSLTYKLLFVSYQDGTTLIGQLNPDSTMLTEVSAVYEDEQDGKLQPAGLHHWKELLVGSGLFVCFSSVKSNSALTISFGTTDFFAQNMRQVVSSNSSLVGIIAYKSVSKDKIHCLALHDDGSLQIYSHVEVDNGSGVTSSDNVVKRLTTGILNNKAYGGGVNPQFPLDFFEKTVCITADVKLGGDAVKNIDSEVAKQSLASEDGFLESPSPAGFKITVSNSNPDIVMVGFRLHVGNISANYIPSDVTIFQRVVKLDEGMRSWYDIPFTVAESLIADEEFVISVGPTFNGSTLSRIDSFEVYGRAKEEFGWKEKIDTMLEMEARALGCNSINSRSGKKCGPIQSSPIQEQVVANGMHLLSAIYHIYRTEDCSKSEDDVKEELRKLKCKQLLETIFESEKESLLQGAACRVLHAVFPRKEIYYQVKDTMRLLGVLNSTRIISSRLGLVASTGWWIIEEFTTQMQAVSKIALHRRPNLATFLEMNGSEVVDGLMQVLWKVLDVEQPDAQTMNNIVISSVELIYCYAECLAIRGNDTRDSSVSPAVVLLKKLLFSPNEAVQTSSSLAISSRLLQVPFPKQTMLSPDDTAEHVRASTSSGRNAQVIIEEDTITSSVQYSCDGCSTVPILRRRWHCTICPDFDLCEACYEVLEADQLPLPHSRDHAMSAIPIELESLGGGEGSSDIHFPRNNLNDSDLLRSRNGSQTQNSIPSIHVLEEASESGEFLFSGSVVKSVSISASKQAVNSLLLSELLEQLNGWMENTPGIKAIPVMQLLYRLSSAVGGPFIDSSKPEDLNLEKLIKWFLNEINLDKPFDVKSRSSFGEVAILVFMFFTLMLRNWHHSSSSSSDGSASKLSGSKEIHDRNVNSGSSSLNDQKKTDFASQLLHACSSLRQQSFVNYIMDILQQLVHVFKSPTVNVEATHGLSPSSGCGSLLTIRKELPSGNFSPFFADPYAKTHRTDIFMDYHRLLLENAFRLVYSLVRPEKQDKSGEKERVGYKRDSPCKDLKLDGYQDVLCSYINNPRTTFVRRYARRLFLHLCGSKTQYYSVRDTWQFTNEVKKLRKHIEKSGGFQNPNPTSYERSVKIVRCLSTMAEIAASRPRNWQEYCVRHGEVLSFLMEGVFFFGEESTIQTLKLLNLAFYAGKETSHSIQKKAEVGVDSGTASLTKSGIISSLDSKKKKKTEDLIDSGSKKSYLDMESVVVDIFGDKGDDILEQFIDSFLLEWNSSSVRVEAKGVLYGVWHHGKQSFKETMLKALLKKVKSLPLYGQNIIEYTELLTWILGKILDNNSNSKQQCNNNTKLVEHCLTHDVIKCIFETLHSQNELLANHHNSRIYNTLSSLVEFDGYYLESEPCVACSSPDVPYSRMKLESLKSESKFTDNRIIVKCTGSYTIQTVTMNVHDAGKSKSVKVLNLYYNNRPVVDLSELKNNWSLWKRAKSCHLAFNQNELKIDFSIPITACNFMIELDSFYENLQALSLEPLQCPRCSRPVTDKHGICNNCHENAYQCRQCRNINYENLDSFLCNECGYSKYGRFEFNFMAKPSFTFDNMENDEDMKKGLAAIESESENAHRRYQQLLGFKKPLLKIVSNICENDTDSQQKDYVQQMMVSLPGPACKINRKIALLGVLYGEKCKAAFDSVSKSVQTLQGLRRVLMNYLHQKHSDNTVTSTRFVVSRTPNRCYGCATVFVTQCLEILQVLSKHLASKKQLVDAGILSELFENNIHQGPKTARVQARAVLCALSEGDVKAVTKLNSLIKKKVMYCLEHHRSMDIALATHEELLLLSDVCSLTDEFWESRLRIVFNLLFASIRLGVKHPAISENVILPCLRIISQASTPPKSESSEKELGLSKSSPVLQQQLKQDQTKSASSFNKTQDIQLLDYSEWEKGASYLDFVRRQYKVSQTVVASVGPRSRAHRSDYLALKYALRWKRFAFKTQAFVLGSWVAELTLSACSHSIRSEMCMLINMLRAQSSSKHFRLLNFLMSSLPATLSAGESAAEYFELLFKMIDSEDARLFLTVRGCLSIVCKLITQEVGNIESLERSLHIDISQGFTLNKLIELLGKFLEVPNIRSRFMRDNLVSEVLEALIVIRGLIVQKTKLISDCNRLLKDLLDSLLLESSENKRQFIKACICGLQIHGDEKKGRTSLFILEQLCNLICPSKLESVYLLVLNKAHTQEEFIRGSMTKNPYSSAEIGPLMRDVKNKICHQLELIGLLEDDYGMELLVAGNIISLDLSIAQVYEQVWKKSNSQSSLSAIANSTLLSSNTSTSSRDCLPMTVTYRLQGLDGEATEPMIKELDEDREESQDPEIEFAIAGAVREYGGLEIILSTIQRLRDDLKSNHEQFIAVLNLLMNCCKIRENRRALLKLGALGLLLETARRAFSIDAMEPAEVILLIVESLTLEANESDSVKVTLNTSEESGSSEQAKKIVLMFLERLSHPQGPIKKSNKQQRNTEMVARILPYLTYGEVDAMDALILHFNPYLQNWNEFDKLQKQQEENPKDENIAQQAFKQRFALENFVLVSESLKTSSCGERLKDIILEKGITEAAVKHLRDSFAVIVGQDALKSSVEWGLGLKLPSVPLILSMLNGLSMGHFPTQDCIDKGGIMPLLHAFEGVSGENEIGARAENLLDTLSNKEGKGDGFLEEKVRNLRNATKDEMRRRALRKREELLQGLGMRQELSSDGGERIVVARPLLEGLEDVEEEEKDGLACMVCREGYSLRPTDLLGVYSYSKRVNLAGSGRGGGECVYTTVSHFNIIHFQCHQEAKRADAALKNPKKEWDGATLRNNETLCNALFPVRGPSVPLGQYVRYIDLYWDNLNALGRADGSRLRLLTYDIVLMLARFATGASFSADSKGGGKESNSRFLPFMIQMARYLLDQGTTSHRQTMAKSVDTYLTTATPDSKPSPSTPPPSATSGTEETVQFMMVNSLLSESYDSWVQHRRAFLQRGIYHAYMQQHAHNRATSSNPIVDDLFPTIQPMLVYTGLIEQLQQFFKVKKSGISVSKSTVKDDESSSEGGFESWEVVMREKLLNIKEMVGFSTELLTWLDDMTSATSFLEAFDVIGVLADVLSGNNSKCEDFVLASINSSGKS